MVCEEFDKYYNCIKTNYNLIALLNLVNDNQAVFYGNNIGSSPKVLAIDNLFTGELSNFIKVNTSFY